MGALIPRTFWQLRNETFIVCRTFLPWYDAWREIICGTYRAVTVFIFKRDLSSIDLCECWCGKTASVTIWFPLFVDWKALSHHLPGEGLGEAFNTSPFMETSPLSCVLQEIGRRWRSRVVCLRLAVILMCYEPLAEPWNGCCWGGVCVWGGHWSFNLRWHVTLPFYMLCLQKHRCLMMFVDARGGVQPAPICKSAGVWHSADTFSANPLAQ